MTESPITLLAGDAPLTLAAASADGDVLWLGPADLLAATGFVLKPEGLCRDELCFPLPRGREQEFAREGRVNVAAFWRYRGGAVASTASGDAWAISEAPDDHAGRIDSLEAPDFTLPDIEGNLHSLSDFRGQKVFLATWASW